MASNRTIAITGASADIGHPTAVRPARDGALVAICGRRRNRLEAAAAEIEAAGGHALEIVGDVARKEDMNTLVARTLERFGGLDVMISSIMGKRGVPYLGAFAATKFAQLGLAEYLRSELVGTDIHVTVVYPVSTDTELFDVMSRETGTPVSRAFGPPDVTEVADAIARAIDRPVPEVFPHFTARLLGWANAIAPGWCDGVVKKHGRQPLRRS